MRSTRKALGLMAAAAIVFGACSGAGTTSQSPSGSAGGGGGAMTPVKFVLQWVPDSQFAAYFAAIDQGYFTAQGLDVTIVNGGPDVNPMTVVASGGAQMGQTWVPKMLASREGGTDLVDIAQLFQRSGTLEISFKDKNLNSIADLKGKKVGTWLGGNEPELYADLTKNGIDPTNPNDVTIVKQGFDMSQILTGEQNASDPNGIDAAEAMIYNEYAQVLEATNPKTGKLYTPDDLNVINFNDDGVGMLQDMIFASAKWLATGSNADVATKFLVASYKGWIYCRDNEAACVQSVLKHGSQLGASHQTWMLNEVNALIWPSPDGIGMLDTAAWNQTVDIAVKYGVLKGKPTDGAYRTDLAQKALSELGASVDTKGAGYKKTTVTLNPGGN